MTDAQVRDDFEQNVRNVLARDAALQDELARLQDDFSRVRRDRDLAHQHIGHLTSDLTMAKAERDHYMVQVQAFSSRFDAIEKWFAQNAEMMKQWRQEAIQAPFQAQRGLTDEAQDR